jgi:hypothetical protein
MKTTKFSKKDLAELLDVVIDTEVVNVSKARMRIEQDKNDLQDLPTLCGFYQYNKNRIYKRNDLDVTTNRITYWHEMWHAYSFKVLEPNKRRELSDEECEELANAVVNYLHSIKI